MGTEYENNLADFETYLTAFRQIKAQCADALQSMEDVLSAMASDLRKSANAAGLSPLGASAWRIRVNGHTRYVNEKEVERLCKSSRAHLILHVPQSRLRFVRLGRNGKPLGRPAWEKISYAMHKPLLVGMFRPGQIFGNRTINERFPSTIDPRTLSRYMVDVTKLIQGSGTRGPYVFRESGVFEESDSGYGYRFDERRQYLVIEKLAK